MINKLDTGEYDLSTINSHLGKLSTEVLCEVNEGLLFHSSCIHGSIKNTSSKTRVSIDVRFSILPSELGSKRRIDFENIYLNQAKCSVEEKNKAVNFLKYINGEMSSSTRMQHILINAWACESGVNIVAQEAEIEGHGLPVLKYYMKNIQKHKFDKIAIISGEILDKLDKNFLEQYRECLQIIIED
jgi:hypothetical protein